MIMRYDYLNSFLIWFHYGIFHHLAIAYTLQLVIVITNILDSQSKLTSLMHDVAVAVGPSDQLDQHCSGR